MKKKFRRIHAFLLLSTLAVMLYVFYANPSLFTYKGLVSVDAFPSILLSSEQDIYFYTHGFLLTGPNPRYYNWSGLSIDPPFYQDDIRNGQGVDHILLATENYILANGGRIFETVSHPFTLVYQNETIEIKELKEYGDFLFVSVKGEEKPLEPYILVKGSSFLMTFDGISTAHYLSVDAHAGTKGLSLLSLNIDTPMPVSRIFHYTNRNQLHGVLSLEDTFVYNLYRMENNVVLIGNDQILCYNMDGEAIWAVDKAKNIPFDAVKTSDQLILYFKDKSLLKMNDNNALIINKAGAYSAYTFPKYLMDFQNYKKGYLGLEYNHTLVFMDKQGKPTDRHRIEDSVTWVRWTEYQPDLLFIRTQDNLLKTYGTNVRKDDQE